jgi:hypothetical protein
VLVAHSGAGPLLPAVADALGPPIGAYLFVDAGERYPTWRDEDLRAAIPDPELRQRVLAAEVRPQPAEFWTETIPGFAGWPDGPCGERVSCSGRAIYEQAKPFVGCSRGLISAVMPLAARIQLHTTRC